MKIKLYSLVLLLFFGLQGYSQECGTIFGQEDIDRIERNKIRIAEGLVKSRAFTYIPVKFHLIATTDGENRVSYSDVLDQLNNLNRSFHHQEIQFYLEDSEELFNEFDHTPSYNDPRSGGANFRMNSQRVNNAMNVFLVGNIGTGPGGIGQTLGYYTGSNDWIVQLKSETNDFTSTLVHEIGHFFSIGHPHLGWESDPFGDQTDERGVPAPSFTPSGGLTERVDRSNCGQAQDRLCDTPADYNGIWFSGPCVPLNMPAILDPVGDTIHPQANNYMSYFGSCSSYVFTDEQKDLITSDLASPRRNYLRPGLAPPLDSIVDQLQTSYPQDGQKVQNGEPITFDWEDVPNAKYYLIKIAENRSLRRNLQQYIVEESQITLEDFKNDQTYYWTARPFNSHFAPLEAISVRSSFITDDITSIRDLEEIKAFEIFPNPLLHTDLEVSFITTQILHDAQIQVTDLTGKIMIRSTIGDLTAGTQNISLKLQDLSGGHYFVQLISAEGILSRKLIKL